MFVTGISIILLVNPVPNGYLLDPFILCTLSMHPFSTPENIRKTCGFLMFSGGRESLQGE